MEILSDISVWRSVLGVRACPTIITWPFCQFQGFHYTSKSHKVLHIEAIVNWTLQAKLKYSGEENVHLLNFQETVTYFKNK